MGKEEPEKAERKLRECQKHREFDEKGCHIGFIGLQGNCW